MFEEPAEFPDWREDCADDWRTDSSLLASACTQTPGSGLLYGLEEIDVHGLSADEAVTYLQQVDRVVAYATGFQAAARAQVMDALIADEQAEQDRLEAEHRARNAERLAQGLRQVSRGGEFVLPEHAVCHELGAALRMPSQAMSARLHDVQELAGPWRPLRDALLSGIVSPGHVFAVGRELRRLPAADDSARTVEYTKQCTEILAKVIVFAESNTAGRTANYARRLVAAEDPVAARKKRREVAQREHDVDLYPGSEPGTVHLLARLPIGHGHACMKAIQTLAKDSRFIVADECATAGQRRVAALVALVLGDPGSVASVSGPVFDAKLRANVHVVVPLATMLAAQSRDTLDSVGGIDALQGGTVAGHPVAADVVLDLLGQADPASTLRRLVTDPGGSVVDLGRSRYTISEAQRHLIQVRDRTCRFVGCGRPATGADVDHALPWAQGGATDLENLGSLCRHHHQAKTHAGWRITASARDGSCTWVSPRGRIYEHEPPALLPPPPRSVVSDDDPPPF